MKRAAIAVVGLCAWGSLHAQVDGVPRDVIEQRIEAAAEQLGGDNDVDLTNLFEVLTDRYNDPIDLNHTDARELNSLLLLNDVQVSSILQHIQRNGKLRSIYELQTINGLDAATINIIRPYITVRENAGSSTASLKEILKRGGHEVTVRSIMNIEERRGFMDRDNLFGKEYSYPNGTELPDFSNSHVVDLSLIHISEPTRPY